MTGVLSGWSQGDFVPLAAHRDLGLPDDGSLRAIITPYSCVMAQAEPQTPIDLLLVRPAKKDAGSYFGRRPRRINLLAGGEEGEIHFEATPADRIIIGAQQLILCRPDPSIQLDPAHRKGLSYWMAQRFLRSALPDDFNEAWAPASEKLRKLAKRLDVCWVVLLMQRATESGKYEVKLRLVVNPYASNSIEELHTVGTEMEKALSSCERIEEVEVETLPADAVSLRDFLEWSHFDVFDDISMKGSHAGPANHAHGAVEGSSKPTPFLQRLRRAWIVLLDTGRQAR